MSSSSQSNPEMNCEDVRDLLYLFVTNELGDETDDVCRHLADCADCRKALAEHVKLAGKLSSAFKHIELRYYSRRN